MPVCYILYSDRIQSYYIGWTTESINVRLERHNSKYYDDKWSSRGIPWSIFLVIECESSQQARSIEAHIKRMKSKVYIQNLSRYSEMIEGLKNRYHWRLTVNSYPVPMVIGNRERVHPDSYRDWGGAWLSRVYASRPFFFFINRHTKPAYRCYPSICRQETFCKDKQVFSGLTQQGDIWNTIV